MRKKILLATSALVISAGSIFAYSNADETIVSKNSAEQCPPGCCNGNEGCGSNDCQEGGEACCEK